MLTGFPRVTDEEVTDLVCQWHDNYLSMRSIAAELLAWKKDAERLRAYCRECNVQLPEED